MKYTWMFSLVIILARNSGADEEGTSVDSVAETQKENPAEDTASEGNPVFGFPSLAKLVKSDSFSLNTPQADLSPTSLLENSPMSFSVPSVSLNLEETDLAINSPMSFTIPQVDLNLEETELSKSSPMDLTIGALELDLNPSFFRASNKKKVKGDGEKGEESDQTKPEESESRVKRQASSPEFPSFFSSLDSSSFSFRFSFPRPDLQARNLFSPSFRALPLEDDISANIIRNPPNSVHSLEPEKLVQSQVPVRRRVRQFNSNRHNAPRYPPFDPFNTTYIPLPGPSSPSYALPLAPGNPHMKPDSRKVRFRRPIRQSGNPHLKSTNRQRSLSNFRFENSREFLLSGIPQYLENHPRLPRK